MAGTSFDIDVGVRSSGIDASTSSIAALSDQLQAVKATSTAASEAVAAGEQSYKAAAAAADSTAKALERVSMQAEAQRGKLAEALEMGNLAGATRAEEALQALAIRQTEATIKAQSAETALAQEARALDELKAAASAAGEAEKSVSDAHDKATEAALAAQKATEAASGNGKVNEAAEGLGKLGGPLGKLGQQVLGPIEGFKKLYASMGDKAFLVAGAVGIAAIAAAVIAVGAAAAFAAAKFAWWAVTQADAARTQNLLNAGITQSVAGGQALTATIDGLAKKVPLSNEELGGMAKKLADAGLSGKALESELTRTAEAAAKAKFGPEWGKQMLSLDQQTKTLKANVSGLFAGLKIEKLLESFAYLVALFDSTSVTGQVIKTLFEELFQPAIDGSASFVDTAAAAFIQFEIWVLTALLALKPFGAEIRLAGELLYAMVGSTVIGALVVLVGTFAAAASTAMFFLQVANSVFTTLKAGVAWIGSISLSDIGANMMKGLADGITGGSTAVVDSMKNAVNGAVDSAKKALGIHSPSTLLYDEVGSPMIAGAENALVDGAPAVQSALEAAVTPSTSLEAVGGTIGPTPAPGAGPSGGNSLNLAGAIFNFYGVKDADDAVAKFEEALSNLLSGDVRALTGEPANA